MLPIICNQATLYVLVFGFILFLSWHILLFVLCFIPKNIIQIWQDKTDGSSLTVDIFMLEKCGSDFNFFYLASTNLEVWGSQFKSLSHIPSTSNTDYKSLSPILRRECNFPKSKIITSGKQLKTSDTYVRFWIFMGQRRSMSQQLQTQW